MHQDFLQLINNKWKFRLFLLKNLPSALFSGVRLVSATTENCTVTVPYKWFSRNPFKSTYFACLAMAAEMSTGVLALGNIYKKQPKISMLVVQITGEFFKKADGITTFHCNDGLQFEQAIADALLSGNSKTVVSASDGFNKEGMLVARFTITWSFKAKSTLAK